MAQNTGSATTDILHTATVVLTIVTLTALVALTCILLTWATARIVRRRRAHQQATLRRVKSDIQSGLGLPAGFNMRGPRLMSHPLCQLLLSAGPGKRTRCPDPASATGRTRGRCRSRVARWSRSG